MPLKSGSTHAVISENIAELIKAGHDPKQAEAIAYREAGRAREDDPKAEDDMMATSPNSALPVGARKRQAHDQIALDASPGNRTRNVDGHLHVASSVVSAAQVNDYRAEEIPNWQALGLQAGRVYALLRDPIELEKAAHTLHGKPLVTVHRAQTADDHDTEITVGTVTNPVWESPNILAEITVWDGDAIALIESGEQRDVSAGYRYTPVVEQGEFNGVRFDIRMKDIEFNHLALVKIGRVIGAVVGDSAMPKEINMAEKESEKAKDSAEEKDEKAKDAMPKRGFDGIKDMLKAKLSEDDFKAACDAMEPEAEDGEEDDEESVEKIEGKQEKEKALDKRAKDKARDEKKDDDEEEKVSKGAMDAALASVAKTVRETERGIRVALADVEPWVGKLSATLALDSKVDVYRHAATILGIDGAKTLHAEALWPVIKAQTKPGSKRSESAAPRMNYDSSAFGEVSKIAPGIEKIRIGA